MKSYHWFSRPENRLRDFWQFQILAPTLPILWPWVNQLLKRILSSESTAKRSALQACRSVLNGTWKAPAPASAIVLMLGRHRDHCSLQGRGMCLVLGLPSSLQALTKIVQCLPDGCLCCCFSCLLSGVWLLATSWTVARQAPPAIGFPRQEYQSGLSLSPPGDLPDPGIEPESSALAGRFSTTEPQLLPGGS